MADKRDPDLSRRYRELGAEEPPRALDEAILAASRRAVDSRPAPLVAPTGRRRWYFPVAAAAIITLAVAVTVQVERQKPDDEFFATQAPAPKPVEEKVELALKEERVLKSAPAQPKPAAPAPQAARSRGFTPEPPATAAPPPPAAPPPAQPGADAMRDLAKSSDAPAAAAAESARAEPERRMQREAAGARGPVPQASSPAPAPAAKPAPDLGSVAAVMLGASPELWLEQIAELRKQGKHDEADKALAEFRKRHPDYKLTDEMRVKVERKN
jgi:hypothetical protein